MSSRQLIFLGVVGVLAFVVAIVTGPMVIDVLLGETSPVEQAPAGEQSADGAVPHPEATP